MSVKMFTSLDYGFKRHNHENRVTYLFFTINVDPNTGHLLMYAPLCSADDSTLM